MSKALYDEPRPRIPAEIARLVKIESGHACAIKECSEHTYLEFHHIDRNRTNNAATNLILLCDKHHKMAHTNIIDRKDLYLYKNRLSEARDTDMQARVARLEKKIDGVESTLPVVQSAQKQPIDTNIKKFLPPRSSVQTFALCQVAITKYEKDVDIYFARNVEFIVGNKQLVLDGLKQFEGRNEDIIIDFVYLRKSYLDLPIYGVKLQEKLELYELMTGRKAHGVLLVVARRESMLEEYALPFIRQSVRDNDALTLQLYSCGQVGFDPGAISLETFVNAESVD